MCGISKYEGIDVGVDWWVWLTERSPAELDCHSLFIYVTDSTFRAEVKKL